MIGILIVVLFAALAWVILAAVGAPSVLGIIAAILILIVGIGGRGRW